MPHRNRQTSETAHLIPATVFAELQRKLAALGGTARVDDVAREIEIAVPVEHAAAAAELVAAFEASL